MPLNDEEVELTLQHLLDEGHLELCGGYDGAPHGDVYFRANQRCPSCEALSDAWHNGNALKEEADRTLAQARRAREEAESHRYAEEAAIRRAENEQSARDFRRKCGIPY